MATMNVYAIIKTFIRKKKLERYVFHAYDDMIILQHINRNGYIYRRMLSHSSSSTMRDRSVKMVEVYEV